MKLSEILNQKFNGLLTFSEFKEKYALLLPNPKLKNPDVKIFIALFPNNTYKVFDGGNTLVVAAQKYNLSSKEFIKTFTNILDTKKVSKQDNILYIDCKETALIQTIYNFYNAQDEILNI